MESCVGANDYRVKMGSKTKIYHVNMLKKYISREPEGNVVPVDDTDDATVAVDGVIHQSTQSWERCLTWKVSAREKGSVM